MDSRFLIPEDSKTDVKEYTMAELAKATNDFVHQVGEGTNRKVYKGTLADGQVVSVKVFDYKSGTKPFLTELEMLGLVPHLNVVTLLGFCCLPAAGYRMLVYKFVPRGILRSILQSEATVLTWAQRYSIAHGVARALLHLHHECVRRIVHMNVTSAHILIDDDYSACLGCFSMAVFLEDDVLYDEQIVGTPGCIAPEYLMTCRLGPEVDVFSFGVVLLELASGRSPIMPDRLPLTGYVGEFYKHGRLVDAMDERVRVEEGHDNEDEMNRLLLLGLTCCQDNPEDRPTMGQVVSILSKEVAVPLLPIHPGLQNKSLIFTSTSSISEGAE